MPKLVAFLFSALLAGVAVAAAEGPRKVWTAAEVIAVSGGTPPAEAVAAEAAAADPAAADPAARAATAGKTKPRAKKAGVKAKKKAVAKKKRKAPAAKARR